MKSRIILSGMALALASVTQAAFTPVAIQSSSYNADVIVESNATPRLALATTASIDQGTNNYAATLFEVGRDLANPLNGLPAAGSTFVSYDNTNYSFQMAPSYVGPNGLLIDAQVTTGHFTPITPHAYTTLSFLGLGGNGGDTMTATVYHQDGTSETGNFGTSDWFGGPTGIAVIMGGRINQVCNLNTETDGNSGDGLGNPRVYHKEITLSNTTSPVTNIVLTYTGGSGGSHSDVMAVSGALTGGSGAVVPIPVTGYDYDFVVEAAAPHDGRILSQTIVDGTNVWATDQSLDNVNNTANSWYEQGYNLNNSGQTGGFNNPAANWTGTGLPHPGSLITNGSGDHIYKMPASYTAPNAVYISTVLTNATITLTTPAAFTGLSFLASGGNGPIVANYVITHTGGITETGVLSVADWFNGSAPAAFIANGRVEVDTAHFQNVNGNNPRLIQNDLVLTDTTDPVVSIYLENTNTTGGRFAILAVSASAGALPPAIAQQPVSVNQYVGASVTFTSTATANASITYQWQKGTNGVYANLSNGGNILGVTSTILSISPIGFTDQADYRIVATDVAGFAPSGAATLSVFSTNLDVTMPGDPITALNVSTFGDGPAANAIDDNMANKFGANINGGSIAALVVSPVAGRTLLSGLRIYTGNDSTGRDPASYKLEGSLDGGATYTLISSNSIALPDGRNNGISGPPNPLTQFVTEVRFSNANGYTTYKLSFPTYKGSGQVQFQEMELLGVVDTSKPFFNQQPADAKAYGSPSGLGANSATFTANAIFTPTPTISWRKGTNGVYVPLTDGGNISGSQSGSLTINPTTFADSADYIAVANSTAGFVTSSIAHLFIYSTNMTVAASSDPITSYGDITGTRYGANVNPSLLIDTASSPEWITGGSGDSAGAGFPPFGETGTNLVAIVLTPAVGSTVLTGLRIYPGADSAAKDPGSFVLQGSNDGGVGYTTIASGSLSLPLLRNVPGTGVNPIDFWAQEVLFSNTGGYTTYRLHLPTVRDPSTAESMHVAEIEFLGVPGVGVFHPSISGTRLSGGNLHFTISGGASSGTFTVQTNANLTAPLGWGTATTGTFVSGSASISLPVSSSNPRLFYRILTP